MSIWNVFPETLPPATLDRSGRLVWLSLGGYPRLAADTILSREVPGKLEAIMGNSIRLLNSEILRNGSARAYAYETLIEIALNLSGMERKRAGFSEEENEAAFGAVLEALRAWEASERESSQPPAVDGVVRGMVSRMKMVLFGQGMVAKMGEEIEKELDEHHLATSFVLASRKSIRGNVYYAIVDQGLSKLGNDSATGLRWVRHLGGVQVSSNPVIAARAYDELPELWEKFRVVADAHPEWRMNPEGQGDDIALYATVVALLPNLLDFRPIALLSDFKEGMVSIQLNPYKAGSVEGSVGDARRIYGILQEILQQYDMFLMGPADFEGRGRPNVVFKVAAGEDAAIRITEALDKMGIGTNNTVTFTVSQEIILAIAAMKGMAAASKMGIPITRVYITNMEGRLEDHLREDLAAELIKGLLASEADPSSRISTMANAAGASKDVGAAGTIEEKIAAICARKYLKSLTEGWFRALFEGKKDLSQIEKDIRWAGILVTRRVFGIAFGPGAAAKWAAHLESAYEISNAKARQVFSMVDLLPASKRREEDTLMVLGGKNTSNLTNTEFPDQQLKVWTKSRQAGFELSEFENTLADEPDSGTLARLMKLRDFRRAYELTQSLSAELGEIGMRAPQESGGLPPVEWASFGPAMKTMKEFRGAYTGFRNKLVTFVTDPLAAKLD